MRWVLPVEPCRVFLFCKKNINNYLKCDYFPEIMFLKVLGMFLNCSWFFFFKSLKPPWSSQIRVGRFNSISQPLRLIEYDSKILGILLPFYIYNRTCYRYTTYNMLGICSNWRCIFCEIFSVFFFLINNLGWGKCRESYAFFFNWDFRCPKYSYRFASLHQDTCVPIA